MRLQGVTGLELSIRDISVRLHDLTGLGHLYEDAYTRYQD